MPNKESNKKQKAEVLEDILFSCRDFLRGRASLTDKRDILLTMVFLKFIFLKFISERYHERCEEKRKENADVPEFAEVLLSRQSQFGEKGVFMLTEEIDWDKLRLIGLKMKPAILTVSEGLRFNGR